ncbi:MAG: glycosyltransferase family 39 protein [Deltaproteobacteria bacterium]|nr:glycosyltransferase family 39 protein [Deltaproteobacteria bacterium]
MTDFARHLFVDGSYYFMGALVIVWGYVFFQWLRNQSFTWNRRVGWGLLAVIALSMVVWFGVERGFKVLADESNHLAISRSLTFDKKAINVTQGQFFYDNFRPITSEIPKRPLLFPFLLSVVHSFLGYDIANAFALNGIILFLLLGLVFFWIGRTRWGVWGGVAAALLVAAQPIVGLNAASAGYDLLACLLLIWSLFLVFKLCEKRDSQTIALLWVSLILLSNVRPESGMFFPLILGLSFFFRLIRWSDLKERVLFFVGSFVFFLPRLWQLMLPHDYENPQNVAVIGLGNFLRNIPDLGKGLFHFGFLLPYATLLNLAALLVLAMFLVKTLLVRKESISPYRPFGWIAAASVLSGLFVYVGHHFGHFYHPTQTRFFLVFVLSLSLMPFLLHHIFDRVRPLWVFVAGLSFFAIYFPVAREQRHVNSLTLIRKTRAVYEFFDGIKEKDVLVITDRPGIYTIRNMGSVNFTWAQEHRDMIRENLNRKLYQAVFVVEDIPYNTGISLLGSVFPMETIREFQNSPQTLVRIAKVLAH